MLSALESECCAMRTEGLSRPCFPIVQTSRNMALFMFKPSRNNPLGNIDSVPRALLNMGEPVILFLSNVWAKMYL